jgi:hypothetical protein
MKFDDLSAADMEDRRLAPLMNMLARKGDGMAPLYTTAKIDELRNCIKAFNKRRINNKEVAEITVVSELGWQDKNRYLVDNLLIEHDSTVPIKLGEDAFHNMFRRIDLDGPVKINGREMLIETDKSKWEKLPLTTSAGSSKVPCFAVISPDKMRSELLPHFIEEFLKLHNSMLTYVATGFTFAAPLQRRFFPQAIRTFCPTLFLPGLSNKGKSKYTHILQGLFGNYLTSVKWDTTRANLLEDITKFKDIIFCLDDFKKTTTPDPGKVPWLIQLVYDQGMRGVQTAKNEAKETYPAECLFIANGEDIFESDYSVASRCIVIDYNKYHQVTTNEKLFLSVMRNKQKYSAITAYLIAYAMTMSEKFWEQEFERFVGEIKADLPNTENVDRVIENVSLAYLGMGAFLSMAMDWFQVLDKDQHTAHMNTLMEACKNAVHRTLDKLKEDKPSVQFLRTLSDLINTQANKYYIEGIGTPPDNPGAVKLGFWQPEEPQNIYFFKDPLTHHVLDKMPKNNAVTSSLTTIGMSLKEGKRSFRPTFC